jgi:CO/xanthine dehydrogenase FAD-binding subunit
MKPVSFDYFAPTTVNEAVALLEEHGDDAKILAGGQSLVPLMNFRLVRPTCLVDINHIRDLAYIHEKDDRLHIGAITRHRDLETSTLVQQSNGLLFEGVQLIGHTAIRTRGTVGGSIIHADPTAELPAILAALDGEVRLIGPNGQRTISWRDLFVTFFTTVIEPVEICDEIIIPRLPSSAGWAFEEFTRRHGDFAVAGVAAVIVADNNDCCTDARLAITGTAPTPIRATQAEAFLVGKSLTQTTLDEAGRLVSTEVEPESDVHATANYRQHLAGALTTRALQRAVERCLSRKDQRKQ